MPINGPGMRSSSTLAISTRGLTTSTMGLGCMGMSGQHYGPADWEASIATIHRAIELGVTLLDTADVYGFGHNEVLVGRAIHDRRDTVQLATKFGLDFSGGRTDLRIRGAHDYVLQSCDASLLRLGVDHIDLYYMHRPSQDVEIEETIGAMAELPCVVWRFFDPAPVGLDPLIDGGPVAFGRLPAGALDGPAHAVSQQRPHVRRVVADPGQPLDHLGDAVQRPQLALEPVRDRALQQGLLARPSSASDRRGVGPVGPRLASALVPPVFQAPCQVLAAWRETPSWRATSAGVDAGSKQLGGAQPAGLELLAVAVGLGAAGCGRHVGLLAGGGRVRPHTLPKSTQSPNLFNGSLLITAVGRGGSVARP
jgi:hypothetical protein